ncbi:MAG TPA: CPBP family intramembrane glutamic endopeptidase [Longimicrobiaceae bacterium]|nr:CPBP family intramembrane glutamic endopeptidase [Longimicrobiaceae bacterium]
MRRYYELSRTQTYSLLFAIPLLLLYEAGAAWVSATSEAPLRNGADVLLRALLATGGLHDTIALTAFLVAVAGVVVVAEWRRKRMRGVEGRVFAGMMAESAVYALLFGVVVGTATQWVLEGAGVRLAADGGTLASLPLAEGIVLSLGAGIYEELVFRVLLAGGLFLLFRSGGLPRTRSGVFAALLSALAFSAFHYIGPYGDPWQLGSFTFRFLAGLAFSALFLVRGFGIAAWTHALYDVFLLLFMLGR